MTTPRVLTPGAVTLDDLETIHRENLAVTLDRAAKPAIDLASERVAEAASGEEAVYGVNTGFGKLASVKIASADTATLQRNLILSHCCGVGEPLDIATTRLMMALKLVSVGRGASGLRPQTIDLLEAMLAHGVVPVVPEQGSVGASGDLAPLAHMTAAMIGEGEAFLDGERMPAARALERAGLSPVELGPKEGLGLINGTQFSTACALAGLFDARKVNVLALFSGAVIVAVILWLGLRQRARNKAYGIEDEPRSFFIARNAIVAFALIFIMYKLSTFRGLPNVLLTMGVLTIIYAFITEKTVIGRRVYALGGNEKAAALSGINTRRLNFIVFVNMGMLAALAGLVFAARLNIATPKAGNGFELDVIAAVFIGGASMSGGVGKIVGAVVGAFIMGIMNNGMSIMGIGIDYQQVIKGLVLLAAVVFDVYNKNKQG